MTIFDKQKYKKKVMAKYKNYETYAIKLTEEYGLSKKKDAVTKWGQLSSTNVPTAKDLPIVAKSLDCTILDLFDDVNDQKLKIIQDELKNPSTKEIQQMLTKQPANFFANSGDVNNAIVSNSTNTTQNLSIDTIANDRMLKRLIEVYLNADDDTKDSIYFDVVMKQKSIQ